MSESYKNLSDLVGEGWKEAEVETLDDRGPIERYSVGEAEFIAGPGDGREGRTGLGEGVFLGVDDEGSSKTMHFGLGSWVVDIERDYQPGAVSPRMRVRERSEQ